MPDQRILHCSLTINQSMSFIHGGKSPVHVKKKYDPFVTHAVNDQDHRMNGYKTYRSIEIENKTNEDSFLYDWDKEKWIKVWI